MSGLRTELGDDSANRVYEKLSRAMERIANVLAITVLQNPDPMNKYRIRRVRELSELAAEVWDARHWTIES